jgi:inosose dehydratase
MAHIKIGNAPCSWGNLEFGLEGEVAPYTQVLDELAGTGYVGTELGDWGFMPTDPGKLAEELGGRGLTMLGAFVPVTMKDPAAHAPGVASALKVARLLRATADRGPGYLPFLVLADNNGTVPVRTKNAGRVTPEMGLTDEEWQVFAAGAEKVACAVFEETGLRTVFHHHCAGYVETPDEIARLLSMTDPNVLGLVFDTGHYAFGAGDCAAVAEGLERFADRIWYIHFKDCHPGVTQQAGRKGGTTSRPWARACSASWARAASTSPRWRNGWRPARPEAGARSSRTCCPAAVAICSATDTHARSSRRRPRAGKHIFCEKPIALRPGGDRPARWRRSSRRA